MYSPVHFNTPQGKNSQEKAVREKSHTTQDKLFMNIVHLGHTL